MANQFGTNCVIFTKIGRFTELDGIDLTPENGDPVARADELLKELYCLEHEDGLNEFPQFRPKD
ncbi:hypothetical protein C5Y96_17730 [Blastopirellula marina]|uniref:Uncharacterized protein n=1 Tax=Blastopirellula marina TaxID=124 RepID=A0A2S8F5E5_9BACT|nr:hypothetical protein C5Y96_17730 [Blastopirellula marina]RCS47919.1 hypothetical protein DTL36_17755 [Bremerella cremea]